MISQHKLLNLSAMKTVKLDRTLPPTDLLASCANKVDIKFKTANPVVLLVAKESTTFSQHELLNPIVLLV